MIFRIREVEESIEDLDIVFASTSRIRKVNKKFISILNLKSKLKKIKLKAMK